MHSCHVSAHLGNLCISHDSVKKVTCLTWKMVYDSLRAYWEQPPSWKIAGAVGVSAGVSYAFYLWLQKKYSLQTPITVTPAWDAATWLRSYNKEREAGDPVILNPFR